MWSKPSVKSGQPATGTPDTVNVNQVLTEGAEMHTGQNRAARNSIHLSTAPRSPPPPPPPGYEEFLQQKSVLVNDKQRRVARVIPLLLREPTVIIVPPQTSLRPTPRPAPKGEVFTSSASSIFRFQEPRDLNVSGQLRNLRSTDIQDNDRQNINMKDLKAAERFVKHMLYTNNAVPTKTEVNSSAEKKNTCDGNYQQNLKLATREANSNKKHVANVKIEVDTPSGKKTYTGSFEVSERCRVEYSVKKNNRVRTIFTSKKARATYIMNQKHTIYCSADGGIILFPPFSNSGPRVLNQWERGAHFAAAAAAAAAVAADTAPATIAAAASDGSSDAGPSTSCGQQRRSLWKRMRGSARHWMCRRCSSRRSAELDN